MNKYLITLTVCRELASARRSKGMTQSALALAAGCKQSAISMLESGRTDKIAMETVEKIAGLLGVTLAPAPETPAAIPPPPPRPGKGFCPNAHCPGNIPYAMDGRVLFWPRLQDGPRCMFCGEVLETACPSCGAPLHEGACCTACGEPLVTAALPEGTDPAGWAAEQRRILAEIRGLLTTAPRPQLYG